MKQFFTISIIFLLTTSVIKAQTYSLTTTSGTYDNLTNPISLNNNDIWEMPDYIIPIGFDFWYFNSTIDTLYFFETAPAMLSSSNEQGGFHQIIIPFGTSLVDRGLGTSHSLSPLSYELSGDIGNRIFKMEWKNVGFLFEYYANNTLNDYANFQLWLYEESGNIEMHYGPTSISHPELAYAGETGPSVSLIPKYDYDPDTISSASLWLYGNPNAPVMMESNNYINLIGTIAPNTVYQFNNLTVSSPANINKISLIFPNPVKDILNIRLDKIIASTITVYIYDISGRKVYDASVNMTKAVELQICVSDLTSGIFQLIIKQGQETYTSRFVKL